MTTPRDYHIRITGIKDENTEKLLCDQGKLFCEVSASHDIGHPLLLPDNIPWDHSECERYCLPHEGKPLLFVEKDSKVTIIPLPASMTFVRLPNNSRKCIEYPNNLTQAEVAEAMCICGTCWERGKKEQHKLIRETKNKEEIKKIRRRGYTHIFYTGIENDAHKQDPRDSLATRMNGWFNIVSMILNDSDKNLKAWMLSGLNGFSGDDQLKLKEELDLTEITERVYSK